MNSEILRVGIGMGTNLGDRRDNIRRAVEFLKGRSDSVTVSSLYGTSPVDCPPGSGEFFNAAALVDYRGELDELLRQMQEFEHSLGRPGVRPINSPRPIDLDILFAGSLVRNDLFLTLPHPRMRERLFVLVPLAEIASEVKLPPDNKTVQDLLEDLKSREKDQICHKIGSL